MKFKKKSIIEFLKYFGLTAGVAIMVLILGWSLKSFAQFLEKKPVIIADSATQTITLLAKDAKIEGAGKARLEDYKGEKNIGWWDYKTQYLSWIIDEVAESTTYKLEMRYSRASKQPCEMSVIIGETSQCFNIAGTGGWDSWKSIEMGTIKISKKNPQKLLLKVTKLPEEGVINFVHLKLVATE